MIHKERSKIMPKVFNVYHSIFQTYQHFGGDDYANNKADLFIARCLINAGIDTVVLEPDYSIPTEVIKQLCYAELDTDAEELFWNYLKEQV